LLPGGFILVLSVGLLNVCLIESLHPHTRTRTYTYINSSATRSTTAGRPERFIYLSKKEKEDGRNCTRMRRGEADSFRNLLRSPAFYTLPSICLKSALFDEAYTEPRVCFDLDGNIISVRERWRYFSSVQSHYYYDISAGYTLST
jgi:hypothetical protein